MVGMGRIQGGTTFRDPSKSTETLHNLMEWDDNKLGIKSSVDHEARLLHVQSIFWLAVILYTHLVAMYKYHSSNIRSCHVVGALSPFKEISLGVHFSYNLN